MPGAADEPGGAAIRRPLTLANAEERALRSADGEREYRIFIATPAGPAPPAGYPVIYFLDANSVFGTVHDEVKRQFETTYKSPALIVGIGYPGEEAWNDLRRDFDLTPAMPPGRIAHGPGGSVIPNTGGADHFLDFILGVVRPAVERDYPVDRGRQTLMGHSFGGLFTLHALFTRTEAFQSYVAMSPSIWFGDQYILTEAEGFIARQRSAPRAARLLITAGTCEQVTGECDPAMPRNPVRTAFLETQTRMADRAQALMADLVPLAGTGLDARIHLIEGEHHISVLGASVSRAVRFALSPVQ